MEKREEETTRSIIDGECESSIYSLGGSYFTTGNLPVLIKLRCFCVIPASLNYCWTTFCTRVIKYMYLIQVNASNIVSTTGMD